MLFHTASDHVVGPPPEKEEATEEDGGPQATVQAVNAVCAKLYRNYEPDIPSEKLLKTYDFAETVDWSTIHALAFIGSVLHLKPGLDVFDWGGDETNCRASHDTCNTMAKGRKCFQVTLAA